MLKHFKNPLCQFGTKMSEKCFWRSNLTHAYVQQQTWPIGLLSTMSYAWVITEFDGLLCHLYVSPECTCNISWFARRAFNPQTCKHCASEQESGGFPHKINELCTLYNPCGFQTVDRLGNYLLFLQGELHHTTSNTVLKIKDCLEAFNFVNTHSR